MNKEVFKIREKILYQGYSAKIGEQEIVIQRAIGEMKNDNGIQRKEMKMPATVLLNKKEVGKDTITGLTNETVFQLVNANVLDLTDEQKELYRATFYPQSVTGENAAKNQKK